MLIRSVIPRAIARPIGSPQRGVDSILGEFWSPRDSSPLARGLSFVPRVDVTDSEDSMVFTAELPGLVDGEFEVILEGDVLTLKGEKNALKVEESQRSLRTERSHGEFSRSFQLPFEADPESVSASLRNGVLAVTVPKPEPQRSRSIPITTS